MSYYRLSEAEKRLMRERYPTLVANPHFAPASFKFTDIIEDLDDGDFLNTITAILEPMTSRCKRSGVVSFGEAHKTYSKYVTFVQTAADDNERGAVELLAQIIINSARIEAAAKTRRENTKRRKATLIKVFSTFLRTKRPEWCIHSGLFMSKQLLFD